MQPASEVPFYNRPGIRGALFVVAGLALGWLLFGEADDEGDWDPDEIAAMIENGELPSDFDGYFGDEPEYPYPTGEFEYPEGAEPEGAYYPAQGGWGEDGGFRGQAEVGGVPLTSGTVDTSGEGNSVYSVGGKVIELP